MPIESKATWDELDSPFYIENKRIAESWEEFAACFNAQSTGAYNAYAFKVRSTINIRMMWNLEVSRSHYNLAPQVRSLSTEFNKKLSVVDLVVLCTNQIPNQIKPFKIKRQNLLSSLFQIGLPTVFSAKYRVFGKGRNDPFTVTIQQLLEQEIRQEKLFQAELKNGELEIRISDSLDCFSTVRSILRTNLS